MEVKADKERSSTRRLSIKGLRKNSSYSTLEEDSIVRTTSEVAVNHMDQHVDSTTTDMVETYENYEQQPRKHKRKFSFKKKARKNRSTECLVIEEQVDPVKRKQRKFSFLKKKRDSSEFLVIEENSDQNKNSINEKKNSKNKSKNKYEKDSSLTKDEKRKKKKKRAKRIKKAGRRAAKAVGNGFVQLGTAFRYMSPVAAMSDIGMSNQNYYDVGYKQTRNTSYL